ncbi:hypothetical protein DL770_001399 [Monosporascus sp. CRB-9-2]|nr:hypothetical protein DL770_001399 [Monosporascus sp. CRB-9-2]
MHPQSRSNTSSQPAASTSITTNNDVRSSAPPEETRASLNLRHLPVSVKSLPVHLESWRPQIENTYETIYAPVIHVEATVTFDKSLDGMINDINTLGMRDASESRCLRCSASIWRLS